VRGDLGAPAWILFGIVFLWTPPHFWALSVRYREDYAAAGIPMLPVVRGIEAAVRQILGYAVIVALASLTLPLVADVSWIYLGSAVVLGAMFVTVAVRLYRDPEPARAIRLFTFSNTYLALLFLAVAVDVLVLA
jgi:protoheme IX farnesyltransferase